MTKCFITSQSDKTVMRKGRVRKLRNLPFVWWGFNCWKIYLSSSWKKNSECAFTLIVQNFQAPFGFARSKKISHCTVQHSSIIAHFFTSQNDQMPKTLTGIEEDEKRPGRYADTFFMNTTGQYCCFIGCFSLVSVG